MSRYWEIETRLDDNTNRTGNGDLDYEVYGQIAILLNKYVRKEEGKGLSANDFTDEYREKLDGIENKAQVNVLETISVNGGEKLYPDEEKNIDIFVPTKTSEIENDSDFAVTSEDTTFTENVTVEKDLNVNGDLQVSGEIISDITIVGDETISGDLSVGDNLTVTNDLSVSGDTTLHDTTISGNLTVSGSETLSTDLSVGGDTTLSGDLSVSGTSTLDDTDINGNLNVSDDLSVGDDLSVTNDETVGGDLTVNGTSILDDTNVGGDLSVSNDLSVSGDTSLKATSIDGTTIISGTTTIHGDLWVDGTTHTTTEEQINTTADTIILRQNNPTSLGSTYAGIIINKYNGTEELALVTDSDGTLRLGTGNGTDTLYANIYWDDTTEKWYSDVELTIEVEPSGSLTSWQSFETIGDIKHYINAVFTEILFTGIVPIMCRDEDTDLTDNSLLKWNSTDRVARTIASPTTDGQILTYKHTPQTTTTVYTDGTDFYNADGSSTTEPSGTSGTPTLIGEFVLYNDLWYSKDTDWYLVDDFSDNTNWTVVSDQNTIDALELETPIEISSVVYTVTEINTYEWKLSNSAGVSFIGTRAEYNIAKLIPIGTVGHIPSGSLVILTDETDYLNSEDR